MVLRWEVDWKGEYEREGNTTTMMMAMMAI
jgi:hypothetical protein